MIYDITRPYFTEKEAWGEPCKMSGILLLTLLAIRQVVDEPFYVYGGYATTGHTEGSFHYRGLAVDFGVRSNIWEAYCYIDAAIINLQLDNYLGLGVYPHWKPYPGFHIDIRGYKARWSKLKTSEYLKDGDDEEKYVSINVFVDKYGNNNHKWRTI